jgi:predicted MFS family arabinose efflux permease
LGGALVGWIGGLPAFGVAAALSACAATLLIGIAEPASPKPLPQHPLSALREGVVFVLGHRLLRPIFITQFIFNTSLFIIFAVYVPYAIHALQLQPIGVGITLAAFGVGMVAGALVAAGVMRVLHLGAVIAIGPISGLLAALVMILTIGMPYAPFAALSFFLMGAGPIIWVVSTTTLRQTVTPRALLGRVFAINSGLWSPVTRRRHRRAGRRALRCADLLRRRRRRISSAGCGDLAIARRQARAAARDGPAKTTTSLSQRRYLVTITGVPKPTRP